MLISCLILAGSTTLITLTVKLIASSLHSASWAWLSLRLHSRNFLSFYLDDSRLWSTLSLGLEESWPVSLQDEPLLSKITTLLSGMFNTEVSIGWNWWFVFDCKGCDFFCVGEFLPCKRQHVLIILWKESVRCQCGSVWKITCSFFLHVWWL